MSLYSMSVLVKGDGIWGEFIKCFGLKENNESRTSLVRKYSEEFGGI